MRSEGLFINGVYEDVLQEILQVQSVLPEHIMFLQPYSSRPIVRLAGDPPTVEDPVRLFMSVTTDLPTVLYQAEIVGWDDKHALPLRKRKAIERLLWTLQPNEGGLYDASPSEGGKSVNLLHVRRLEKLDKPFSVGRLVKIEGGGPVSRHRTTSGGWTYVRADSE